MKILVTGASGFLGNYVIDQLLQRNHEVIASSRTSEKIEHKSWFKHVAFIPFDLNHFDETVNYAAYFQQPDAIIHLAWQGLPNYKSLFHFEHNLPLHYSFIKNLVVNGLIDINITGTCFEYGMQEGILNEEMPTNPQNAYAIAKDSLRKFLMQLTKEKTFSLKWMRLFYMYGDGQNASSLLAQLSTSIRNKESIFNMSGGQQTRDFMPVEKMAEKIVTIAIQKQVQGIVNCCSGEPTTVYTLVNNFIKKQNSNIQLNLGYYPYPDYEPMHFWGDTTKYDTIK